ncbi:hypothetical protein GXN76_13460 [Kroppenstedtia pulmonis]|uniref:YugN-like family protein n=1 Tax=Kroppenstedtia pulmonis TaxID=1380685 RepID=A0A7D3XK98_9BACL|nr:YugN family protein [Kroppenstedtia pulmonis]QKG85379.1 hypothetical protein GXN76_13460 [Kroppenstedtia pulmonis]
MITLSSTLENRKGSFIEFDRLFNEEGFNLGGGYEYDHGYYDKALDWEENKEHRVYLRIPVTAIDGSIGTRRATLHIGKPFVLKHQFRTGNEPEVNTGLISGSFNQFTEPADKDAEVENKWINRARETLKKIEKRFDQS